MTDQPRELARGLCPSGIALRLGPGRRGAFGDADAFVVADVPDQASASAVSLAVSASGGARCNTIVLMTPEEVDQASKKPLTYTGPGR
jgi:GYD domain-containing protein